MNTTEITEADVAAYLLSVCDNAVKTMGATGAAVSFSADTQFRDNQTHFAHLRFGGCSVCGSGKSIYDAFADAARQCETPERLLEEKRTAFEVAQKQLAEAEALAAKRK